MSTNFNEPPPPNIKFNNFGLSILDLFQYVQTDEAICRTANTPKEQTKLLFARHVRGLPLPFFDTVPHGFGYIVMEMFQFALC
jgi:hypothetical protein